MKKDTFYEERYEQIKNDLFIGDERHTLGKSGSFIFLYRLFEECYSFDEIFGILDNIRKNDLSGKKRPFVNFDNVTKTILKKDKRYLLTDKNNVIKMDIWDGEKFQNTENPKLVMLYADTDFFETYLQ